MRLGIVVTVFSCITKNHGHEDLRFRQNLYIALFFLAIFGLDCYVSVTPSYVSQSMPIMADLTALYPCTATEVLYYYLQLVFFAKSGHNSCCPFFLAPLSRYGERHLELE